MRLSNGFVIDKEKTFGELKFTAVRDVFLQNEDGTPSTQLKKRIYDLKCSLHGGIIPVSVPPEVPLREFPYNAVVELVNPVADTVSRKTYTGADVDWYVKAEDIVLKNKGKAKTVNVDHQLIYKNLGDGCKFHISTPKTSSGIRIIPMTQEVAKAFEEQRKINFMLAKDKSIEVDGYSGFVFTAKSGRPLMPNGVNSVLYNIVDAYNKTEVERAKKEHRKAELLPKFSAHVMRHTACTRMAECRMDVKVLQYIMGHAHIDVTMEVYNHIGELTRIENEIARLDSMVLNA